MATTIYPNGTVQEQWDSTAGVNHTTIDEVTPDPNDYVIAQPPTDNKIDIYSLPNTIDDVDEVTQIAVKVWCINIDADESPSGDVANVDINLGGYQGAKSINKPLSGLQTLTWAGLSGSQADLDGLLVKLAVGTLNAGKIIDDSYILYCMHIVVTYTPAAPAGYGHDYMGVLAANIDEVCGVPTANIDTIKGV